MTLIISMKTIIWPFYQGRISGQLVMKLLSRLESTILGKEKFKLCVHTENAALKLRIF